MHECSLRVNAGHKEIQVAFLTVSLIGSNYNNIGIWCSWKSPYHSLVFCKVREIMYPII